MGLLSLVTTVLGVFLVGLVAVAAVVAGWEWLRQREMLDLLRRGREHYAATSPLPLAAALRGAAGTPAAEREQPGAPAVPTPLRRDLPWVETRPAVLSYARAADDETASQRQTLDVRLD
jgi:hypothetical protein